MGQLVKLAEAPLQGRSREPPKRTMPDGAILSHNNNARLNLISEASKASTHTLDGITPYWVACGSKAEAPDPPLSICSTSYIRRLKRKMLQTEEPCAAGYYPHCVHDHAQLDSHGSCVRDGAEQKWRVSPLAHL